MIEDSLKTTRTLHRLLLAVSLATIIFSLSLQTYSVERKWQKAVATIIATNFAEYDKFIKGKVENIIPEQITELEQAFRPFVLKWQDEFNVSNVQSISDKLQNTFRVGQVVIDNVGLGKVSDTSLSELYQLNDLQIDRGIELYVPQFNDILIEKIDRFFKDKLGENTRGRIGAVFISDHNSDRLLEKESFIPNISMYYVLSLTLIVPTSDQQFLVSSERSITFDFGVSFKSTPISDSSLIYWIQHEKLMTGTAFFKDGDISFPLLDNMPDRYKRQNLGLLLSRLDAMIENSGPDNLNVTLFGMEVPGLVFVLASPITIGILSWYLLINLIHLAKLAPEASTSFRQFAWMPLMLQDWAIPIGRNGRSIPSWAMETIVSSIILPIASLGVLHFRLWQFKSVASWQTLMFICIAVAVYVLGRQSTLCIGQIRRRVNTVCQQDTAREQDSLDEARDL